MVRNADYVMNYIVDPTKRAKKAQVGVDLTINKVSQVGYPLLNFNGGDKRWAVAGIVVSDETPKTQGNLAAYTEVAALNLAGFTHPVWELDVGVYSIEFEQGLVTLGTTDTAMIINRSTVGRSGSLIRSSIYDPGFTTPNMGALLYVHTPILIEQYSRVAQIVIMSNEEADLYNGSYQGTKDIR